MILAVDVAYHTEHATVGGVLFSRWNDEVPVREITAHVSPIAAYIPGQFYQRELPCILSLLKQISEPLETIIIDGYVYLGKEKLSGLGAYLYHALHEKIAIIGVAKTAFKDTPKDSEIYRGHSQRPLYVTAIGVDEEVARQYITNMSGPYRIPTLLKRVDQLCRNVGGKKEVDMKNCVFCRIIARQAPGYIIDENDQVITFLSLENHPLVVPKQHIADIYSLDERTGHAIMSALIKIANAVKKGVACDGVYITQANEPAAGQDVFHLHFHIYPRWHDLPQQAKDSDDSERSGMCERIRHALQ